MTRLLFRPETLLFINSFLLLMQFGQITTKGLIGSIRGNRTTSSSSMTTRTLLATTIRQNPSSEMPSSPYSPMNRRYELEILRNIFESNYTNFIMPLPTDNRTFEVRTRIALIKIQNLWERTNVKTEALEITMRVQLNWCDPVLAWDAAKYGGVNYVIVPGDRLWIPDIQIINALDDPYALFRDRRFDFKVQSDGCIWWYPTGTLFTRCELDLSYFPFDVQNCPIIIESAMYSKEFLNLTVRYDKSAVSLKSFTESGQWHLLSASAIPKLNFLTKSTAFTRVEMNLEISRKTLYYKINVFFSFALLSALMILTFFLPIGSSDRITHSVTILLSVVVFQSSIVNDLPRTSNSMPLLCLYIDFLIGISVLTVADAIFGVYLLKCNGRSEMLTKIVQFCYKQHLIRRRKSTANSKKDSAISTDAANQHMLHSIIGDDDEHGRQTVTTTVNYTEEETTVSVANGHCFEEDLSQQNNHHHTPVMANNSHSSIRFEKSLPLRHSQNNNNNNNNNKSGDYRKSSSTNRRDRRRNSSPTYDNYNEDDIITADTAYFFNVTSVCVDRVVFFFVLTSSIVVPYYMFNVLPPKTTEQ